MAFLQHAVQGYHYLFDELCDPRTKDWWLMSGPGPLLTILATYIYFCLKAGPQHMKNRKPYNLKTVVMIYNVIQIILSLYITCMGLAYLFIEDYKFQCHSVNYSATPLQITLAYLILVTASMAYKTNLLTRSTSRSLLTTAQALCCYHHRLSVVATFARPLASARTVQSPVAIQQWAKTVWLFFFGKIIELLDTVFFVLRKKDNQVTFLHIYHHTIMPMIAWLGTKYAPGGQAVPEGAINAFIHVIMYSYYLISGLGPQYQKYLWWKKYLTSMQLIQFCIIVYMNTNGLMATNCNYPKFLSTIVMANCVLFFYLFGKFYYNSYVKSKKERTA